MFAALWEAALGEATRRDLGSPDAVRGLARLAGEDALDCVTALVRDERDRVVAASAALLRAATLLWAAMGIEPEEIWMELHKRERLGSLLHEMARGEGRPKRRQSRPWRVDSSKLP